MFKEHLGFDTDKLKIGTAIEIKDAYIRGGIGNKVVVWGSHLDLLRNITGNYIIAKSEASSLDVVGCNSILKTLPINDFTGDNPRMKLRILS